MKRNFVLLILLIRTFAVLICFAQSPIIQDIYTADPAPMVYEGRVYLYTGYDEIKARNSYFMRDYRCCSINQGSIWSGL